ncbi:MAG: hypothetical protein IIV14_00650 [Bacteroidaceae bacterium]|nr:hypothetical protein [Bacteroidaceae bacterium]
MGEALISRKGGGMSINGIIQEYRCWAGEGISAGNFVEYINGVSADTDMGNVAGFEVRAKRLDETRVVFVLARHASTVTNVKALACEVVGRNITVGASISLSPGSSQLSACGCADIEIIDSNQVLIISKYGSKLYAHICSVNGLEITLESSTLMGSSLGDDYEDDSVDVSIAKIGENKFFVAHGFGSSFSQLAVNLLTVDGTTVTIGETFYPVVNTAKRSGALISCVALNDSTVFLAHGNTDDDDNLYGVICNIEAETVTFGENVALGDYAEAASSYGHNMIATIALNENKVLVAMKGSATQQLELFVCSIDGTTITCGESVLTTNSYAILPTLLLHSETEVEVIATVGTAATNGYQNIISFVCSINGDTISLSEEIVVATTAANKTNTSCSVGAILTNEGTPLFLFSLKNAASNNCLELYLSLNGVINSESDILGVATLGGLFGDTIKVAVPELS